MNKERTIPVETKYGLVTFKILSEGNVIDPEYQVLSISVTKEVNRIPFAKIVLRDGNVSNEDFEISNTDDFVPGKKIEIKAGRDGIDETIFKGIVVKHGIKVRKNGNSELCIECRDEAVKLTIGRHNRYFEEKKDSEIISELLGGFAGDVEDTSVKHKEVVQHFCSDWDFILSRAEVNSKVVVVEDGKVNVHSPEASGNPALTVLYGSTLIEFEAEMDARSQYKAVSASSWNYTDQKVEQMEASSTSFSEHGNMDGAALSDVIGLEKLDLRHSGNILPEELQAWADASMLKSRLSKIRGRAKFIGFPDLKPGGVLELKGVGQRFNGKAFVSATQNVLTRGSWITHAQIGLPIEWHFTKKDVIEAPAAGLIPAIHGLQIGKVVQLQDDPDGNDRILVKLPIIDNEAKGIWARVALLDAGNERGTFFRPEIDDEVVVGFINSDPRSAIVLGMLHSSSSPAPLQAQDTNHEKGIFTRSKMRVHFDDEKKIITIDTPAGNIIKLNEEDTEISIVDQNNNEYKMNPDGISMTSPADIKIEATGNIEIKATGDLNMEGMNIAATAQAEFKAEGAAGAKLETSAIAEIKGSLVKIN